MLTSADQQWLANTPGAPRRGIVGVAARCPAGHPAVLTCYPLRRRRAGPPEPFPTLYWLVCPALCRAVAHLERDGLVSGAADLLARDPALRAALGRDHADYAARRWAALTDADRALLTTSGLATAFQNRGVAGIALDDAGLATGGVKCLHAHFAHHLAGGNVIGAWVAREYRVCPCPATSDRAREGEAPPEPRFTAGNTRGSDGASPSQGGP